MREQRNIRVDLGMARRKRNGRLLAQWFVWRFINRIKIVNSRLQTVRSRFDSLEYVLFLLNSTYSTSVQSESVCGWLAHCRNSWILVLGDHLSSSCCFIRKSVKTPDFASDLKPPKLEFLVDVSFYMFLNDKVIKSNYYRLF